MSCRFSRLGNFWPAPRARTGHGKILDLGVALSLVLTLSDTPIWPQPEIPPQAQAAAASPDAMVLERADEASALITARHTQQKVEVTGRRSETTTVVANPDGTLTMEQSARPVRVRRDGRWVAVDTALLSMPDGSIAPATAAVDLKLSGGGSGPLLTMTHEGKSIRLGWTLGALPMPVLDGNSATYPEVLPGVDLRIDVDVDGFEQKLIVKSAAAAKDPALRAVRFSVAGEGLSLHADAAGRLSVLDSGNRTLFAGSPSRMWESGAAIEAIPGKASLTAEERRAATARTAPVRVRVDRNGLWITPDARLLDDPRAVRPIVIDPGLTLYRSSWGMVNSATPTTSYPNPTGYANVGTQDSGATKWRSYWQFDTAALGGTSIVSASLEFTEVASASCTPTGVELWKSSPFGSNLNWNNQPLSPSLVSTVSVAKGFSSACPAGPVSFNVVTQTQAQADAAAASTAYYLRASSETANSGWKQFDNNPSLSVSYTDRPRASALAVESAVQGYVSTSTVPLSALIADAEGAPASVVQFEVTNVPLNQILTYEASNVASGSRASVVATPPVGLNTWRVRAKEGALWGVWTNGPQFAKDLTPPPLPVVASTSFPENGWGGAPHVSGSFTYDSGGATDVAAYIYGLDVNPPTTRVSAAPRPNPVPGEPTTPYASVTVTPTWDGPHTLYVRSQDQAGNLSPIKDYTFNVGKVGMTAPRPNDVTASKTMLAAVGKPGTYDVTFRWRRAKTNTWANIPAGHVTLADGGGAISWPVGRTAGGEFPALIWNTEATLAAADAEGFARDGQLYVSAAFHYEPEGPAGVEIVCPTCPNFYSAAVPIVFDRNRAAASTVEIGPGAVNLLTGNLSVGRSDVNLPEVAVARSFNSRQAGGTDPMFGPGWVSSVIVTESAPYTDLHVYGSLVQVGLPDDDTLDFTETAVTGSGTTYASPVGAEHLTLSYTTAGNFFTLSRADGATVTFTHPINAAATTYAPTSVVAAGSGQTTTLSWEKTTVDGVEVVRPTRLLAPVPSGVTCTTLVRGCRALTITYATATTAIPGVPGDYLARASQAAFTAWDPDLAPPAMSTVVVARYSYDTSGRLVAAWDPRLDWSDEGGVHHQAETYAYGPSGVLTTLTPNAQEPWQFAYTTLPTDPGAGRLATVSRSALSAGTAINTVVYKVPRSGSGAPYDLSATQTARWGQSEPPVDATALFGPDQVPDGNQATGTLPTSYERARVTYLDAQGRTVNEAEPGGSITTTWYDSRGDVVRELSAGNRATALAASGSDTAAAEAALALREARLSVYSADGLELRETLGPERSFALANGTLVRGRHHVTYTYDEGAPPSGPFHLVTTEVTGVQYAAGTGLVEADQRTTTTGYDWTLEQPTIVTRNPGGLALATRYAYDSAGRLVSTTTPAGGASTTTPATQITVYYRSGTGSGYPECDSRPEWDGLVCRTQPGGQAASGPELPVKVTTYSLYRVPRTIVEKTSAGALRTTTFSYDSAARVSTMAISGAAGTGQAVPTTRFVYDVQSGAPLRTQSLDGGGAVTAEVVRSYDTLGRITSYQDADGNVSATTYDVMSRPATATDGKATRTYTYDGGSERRGLLTQVVDSQGGTFTATYDVDGNLLTESRPDSILVSVGTQEDGGARSLTYTKTGCGQPDCTLFSETVDSTVHGQVGSRSSTLSQQRYTYDADARLTSVADVVAGACTTRTYTFTTSTSRSGLTAYNPTAEGACQTTTSSSSRTWTFDTADRVNTAGYTYDVLGRTLTMAAGDSAIQGGSNPSMAYYVNDMTRTVTQGSRTATYTLDVNPNRFRSSVDSGLGGVTKRNHYSADVDSPVWTDEGDGTYSRIVSGIMGPSGVVSGVGGALTWLIANQQGTFVAGMAAGSAGLTYSSDYTENGLPRNSADAGSRRYGWLGTAQRAADTPGGLTQMGARLYAPGSGRFLSVDPVYGGSANPYEYAGGDPVGRADPSGTAYCWRYNVTWRYWYYWWGGRAGKRYDFDFSCYFSDHDIFVLLISGVVLGVAAYIASRLYVPLGIGLAILVAVLEILVAHYWWYCDTGVGHGAIWVGHVRLWHQYFGNRWWGYPWYRYWYCT